jgi:hypothetical protein
VRGQTLRLGQRPVMSSPVAVAVNSHKLLPLVVPLHISYRSNPTLTQVTYPHGLLNEPGPDSGWPSYKSPTSREKPFTTNWYQSSRGRSSTHRPRRYFEHHRPDDTEVGSRGVHTTNFWKLVPKSVRR